jgi:hypothetical protein
LPRLYIQDGEVIILEPEQKIYFTLKGISGFIDPTFLVRTRITLKGEPHQDEYTTFSLRGTLNLLTLAHNLKLNWQGLKLSTLKTLVGGVEFKEGLADIDLTLERRREYSDPWEGYVGEARISKGVAIVKNNDTPIKLEGSFALIGRDFISERFQIYLGKSEFSGKGKMFLFGEPEIDINFSSDALEIEDFLGASGLSTVSGAKGCGKLTLRAFGKMSAPRLDGELYFPEMKACSTSVTDFYASFSRETGEVNLKKLTMDICDGHFTAEGKISGVAALRFNLKEADLHEICNILAYSGVMVNPTLRKYSSQLKGRVNLSGEAKGMISSPRIIGFFSGKDIETANQSFKKAEARFEYNNDGLKFNPLILGKEYCLWSEFYSSREKELQLLLEINNADVASLVKDLELKVPDPFTGRVSGEVKIKGDDIKETNSHGHLTIKQGEISEISFEKMDLDFRGTGQEIDIENSSISQINDKVLIMRGKLFLREDSGNSMEIKPSATGFVWDGWNIEKDSDQMEFNMGRNISKNWYLCFSTPVDNIHKFPLLDRPPRPDTAERAELQYRLDDERRLKLHWRDKEEFIGLEQKFKF